LQATRICIEKSALYCKIKLCQLAKE
jgi:hypothetical protein